MLSRVADALYWLGRYLERAENVTRLVLVTSEFAVELEGLDEKLAQAEWDFLLAALPGTETARLDFSPSSGLWVPYVSTLLLDERCPVSTIHSVGRARENARAVREALTREVFLNLNEAWRDLARRQRARLKDPTAALKIVADTHQSLMTTLGSVENTMTRDQGWTFMKLGEALERTMRTARILGIKLPALTAAPPGVDPPLVYARWRSLLRSVASLENFRRVHRAFMEPDAVLRFLLLDPVAPRSIRCGLERMSGYLDRLPSGTETSPADRLLGRLLAEVRYDDERILRDPVDFVARVADRLAETHEAIARQYFWS